MSSPQNSDEEFHIVGIGASAGGLEAFIELLRALPPRTGMAFVIVQHLEPQSVSELAAILSRATEMPVVQAEEGMRVEPDKVYVIPPNTIMGIREGVLHLAPRSESATPHYPIDRFFESLAADQGARAIGIVLSGGGSDGAQGIRAIKAGFGTTFSQEERTAKYGGMPHSAIATGAVDFVLPPAGIAEELKRIAAQPFLAAPAEILDRAEDTAEEDGDLQPILEMLKSVTRIDFAQYKQSTLRRRIRRRLVVHHLSTLAEYLEYIRANPAEVHNLYRDVLISVTSFFREPQMFQVLSEALSHYLETRSGVDPFRLWVPGCATGEEAYSLAITALEVLESSGAEIPIQVFGTDISETAIEKARSGFYPERMEQEVPPDRLRRFFSRVDSGFRIHQRVRESCVFARHDLASDPPFSQIDLVSCRNVFIYLSSNLQSRILPSLHYSLKPGGLLVLGSAETVGNRSDLFAVLDNENKIYVKKPVPAKLPVELRSSPVDKPAEPGSRSEPVSGAPAQVDGDARAARILRDLYAPPGVLINSEMQVLDSHGQTGFYLKQAPGETGINLLRLARESLVYPLRRAVDTAFEHNRVVHETGIQVQHDGETRRIRLSVIPVSGQTRISMVLFEEESRVDGTAQQSERVNEPGTLEVQLNHARRELSNTRDHLRKIIEEHESTTEELRAANEEARSSNEELQSTNEELRTAKEELQSSNEELTTVNDELKQRFHDLDLATNDLSNILSAATIPIVMVGMDLRVRRFTPAAERLLGLVPADTGRPMPDLHLKFHVPDLKDVLTETIRTLEVQQRRAESRDGRWFNLSFRPYRTTDERIDGAVITFIDIDESTRALEEAERARKFAEGIVETVQHPLLILDSNLRVIRATEAFYKTFQVIREETVGYTIDDLGSGQWQVPELRRLLQQALTRDVPFRDLEITHNFPHIGPRTMRLNARRIGSDAAGHTVLLALEDITDRREAAEIQYRRLFESAKDAIVVLESPSGIVVDVNPFLLEISRYSRADMLGKRFAELPPFLDAEEGRRLVPETLERGVARYDSVVMSARDGRQMIVEMIANGYRVKDRDLIQVNIRDVTERRRMEEDLRRSNLDLQQFAFAASHDLQEPLRTVISFLELFERQNRGKLGPEADQQIKYITTAADHMKHLVLDLLGFSQVVRADLNLITVSAEAILATTLLNLQLAIRSSDARITFDHLPVIEADQTQFVQLLQNLISNSIKYRGAEPPRIHLSAREAGPEWVFSLQDNGIGIDPRYADHIFAVFKRLHGREYPGTGIGLAICKRIIERHNGRIWVESQPGKGSTFYFTVPKRESLKLG